MKNDTDKDYKPGMKELSSIFKNECHGDINTLVKAVRYAYDQYKTGKIKAPKSWNETKWLTLVYGDPKGNSSQQVNKSETRKRGKKTAINFNENEEDPDYLKAEKEKAKKEKQEAEDTKNKEELYKKLKENAKKFDGILGTGVKGSKKAKEDKELYGTLEKQVKNKKFNKDAEYLEEKNKILENYKIESNKKEDNNNTPAVANVNADDWNTMSEKHKPIRNNLNQFSKHGEDKMDISKKDLMKIMSAMGTIKRNFNEQVEEDEVVDEEDVVDTEDTEESTTTIELPEDVADAIREALEVAKEDSESEEDEEPEEDYDDSEDYVDEEDVDTDVDEETRAEEREFSNFAEQMTDCVENLNSKIRQLSKKTMNSAEDYIVDVNLALGNFGSFAKAMTETMENMNNKVKKIENYSSKSFMQFADSITTTLENISARVDSLASKVDNSVTTNLDNLKQVGEKYENGFIVKVDEPSSESYAPIYEMANEAAEPEYPTTVEEVDSDVNETLPIPASQPSTQMNAQFSSRYNKVKNFLSL